MPRHATVACGGAEIRDVFVGIGSFQDHVEYHDRSLQKEQIRCDPLLSQWEKVISCRCGFSLEIES